MDPTSTSGNMPQVNDPEEYNERAAERSVLIMRIHDALKAYSGKSKEPTHFFGICTVCDMGMLEKIAIKAESHPEDVCMMMVNSPRELARTWAQKMSPLSLKNAPTSHQTSSPVPGSARGDVLSMYGSSPAVSRSSDGEPLAKRQQRSISSRNLAKQRDGNKCVITGEHKQLQAAHIFPFCLLHPDKHDYGLRFRFWLNLRNFWPPEKVEIWMKELFTASDTGDEMGAEKLQNLICMHTTAHEYWNDGYFALKPVSMSDDKKILKLKFFWQKVQEEDATHIDLTQIPHSTRGLEGQGNRTSRWLFHPEPPHEKWKSGDEFTMTTEDPENRPLPSVALLELGFHLQRVIGMAGAAESDEDYEDEDYASLKDYGETDMQGEYESENEETEFGNPGLVDPADTSQLDDSALSDPAMPLGASLPRTPGTEERKTAREVTGEDIIGEQVV